MKTSFLTKNCRGLFVEDSVDSSESDDKQEKQLKRFIILNFHGIFDFKFKCGFKS